MLQVIVSAIDWGVVIALSVVLPVIVGFWIVNATMLFPQDSIWMVVRRLLIIAAGVSLFALVVKVVKILLGQLTVSDRCLDVVLTVASVERVRLAASA